MKIANRLGLVVTVLLAALLTLTVTAVVSLAMIGSAWLACGVALAGLLAMAGVGAAYAQARDAERQFAGLAMPVAVDVADVADVAPAHRLPVARAGFKVREARPGEVPEPYLDAVMKGAQATHAAYRAREGQH